MEPDQTIDSVSIRALAARFDAGVAPDHTIESALTCEPDQTMEPDHTIEPDHTMDPDQTMELADPDQTID
jgi:hypothetical protein